MANRAAPSVVTVKVPFDPVSETTADVSPIAILGPVEGACQLGADPEPVLVKTCPLVPKLVPPMPIAPLLLIAKRETPPVEIPKVLALSKNKPVPVLE